jgi:hypothetical protein
MTVAEVILAKEADFWKYVFRSTNITSLGRAVAKAVSRRLPTAASRVRAEVGECGMKCIWRRPKHILEIWRVSANFAEMFIQKFKEAIHLVLPEHLISDRCLDISPIGLAMIPAELNKPQFRHEWTAVTIVLLVLVLYQEDLWFCDDFHSESIFVFNNIFHDLFHVYRGYETASVI